MNNYSLKLYKDVLASSQMERVLEVALERQIMYERLVNRNLSIWELNKINLLPQPKTEIIVNVYIS